MRLSVILALLLCALSTPQLAVASECGIVVVQEEEIKQNIRIEVTTALVSLLRATGRQPPAEISNNQSEIELRAEIRKDVNAALEQTIANVTDVCDYRDEFMELKESMSSELREVKECVKRNFREVNESVNRELKEANECVNMELREVNESVNMELREVNESVNRELREVNESVNRELREVKECVRRDLREVNATMETVIEAAVSTAVEAAVEKATKPIEQLLQSLLNDVALLKSPYGRTSTHPARSCGEILAAVPSSPSGYYWLRAGNGSSIRVYCDMTRTCGGITGGWMQVANIDMTDSSHTCPQGLNALTSPKRLCGINISGRGCTSATFATHGAKYTHVCGKVIGYQYGCATAFWEYYRNRHITIDTMRVGGVSLTHGSNPRKHIWTFAAARHEGTSNIDHTCPCSNPASTAVIPPWVGNDYFCDTAVEDWSRQLQGRYKLYPDDPLWDGEGCGPTSTCCSLNNPPWFSKQLPSPTTDDIEMRLCGFNLRIHEDTQLEIIELYVQ